jgi:P27 family predicted phage terminase small subunit
MRGRKPDNPTLVALRGGKDRKKKGKDASIKGKPVEDLTPPEFLGAHGRELWNEVGPDMVEQGLLDSLSYTSFAALCQQYDRFREAETALAVTGAVVETPNGPRKHPWVAIGNDAFNRYVRMCGEFGLTPVSRIRLKPTKPKPSGDNPFDEI